LTTSSDSVRDVLRNESSVSGLPRGLQSGALRILEVIHTRNVKHVPLRATELRKEARIDTHRFHPVFKWLEERGYCQVTVTRTSRKGLAKLVSITTLGEVALRKRRRLGHLYEISEELCRARSPDEEMTLLRALVVEAFDLVYSEFYYVGRMEAYERFRGGLEESLREHLDKEIGGRMGIVHDVCLCIRTIPRKPLLEDARLARRRGHFLTANHRYILRRAERVERRVLDDHNIRWKYKVMRTAFTGAESAQEFRELADPMQMVEQEGRNRATPSAPAPQTVRFVRDGYDFDKRWNPDVAELQRRWSQACKEHATSLRRGS